MAAPSARELAELNLVDELGLALDDLDGVAELLAVMAEDRRREDDGERLALHALSNAIIGATSRIRAAKAEAGDLRSHKAPEGAHGGEDSGARVMLDFAHVTTLAAVSALDVLTSQIVGGALQPESVEDDMDAFTVYARGIRNDLREVAKTLLEVRGRVAA